MKATPPSVMCFALLLGVSTAVWAATPVAIPLIEGLRVVGAASERQGDYESTYTIDGVDADGTLHIETSADLPDPTGGQPKPVSFSRDVSAGDRDHARIYKYMFSTGPQEFPGTTALGTSAAVIHDLRTVGSAAITFDGQTSALVNLISSFLQLIPNGDSENPAAPYFSGSGTVRAVESRPVAYPMILNDALVSLAAWHVKGDFVQGTTAVPVEWYFLDDPSNPLTLRLAIADWALTVEGHTDNIGGDAANQDLSARRAAAVRAALIQLGISEKRLLASGFGASAPRATNATLAGRARNRRVELTRQ